jgi:predicted RNA-binding Zn-ribbon protein involved in translation (DUF1610 family)
MPLLNCPSCTKPLKVGDELAGKNVQCPSCGATVPVPDVDPQTDAAPEMGEVEAADAVTGKKPTTKSGPRDGDGSKWVACPKCGAVAAKPVKWTFWGSFYGPKIFNHVRCQQCRTTYNGKTGGSNIVPAIGCVLLPLLGIVLILGALSGVVYYRLVYQPAQDEKNYQQQQREEEEKMRSPLPRPNKR